jgi:hypothetical protein
MNDNTNGMPTVADWLRIVRETHPRARAWTELSVVEWARIMGTLAERRPAAPDVAQDGRADGGEAEISTGPTSVVAIIGPDGRDSGWTQMGTDIIPPATWQGPFPSWIWAMTNGGELWIKWQGYRQQRDSAGRQSVRVAFDREPQGWSAILDSVRTLVDAGDTRQRTWYAYALREVADEIMAEKE